ncbi:hypothetical protein SLEP1_g35806 [Rubroshorea leprosula]|uniref:Uncharacterized protein n=1 Tax=Rubroshorea leprosula TaxID=152421 RepID=A0AAV5KPM3_9ROSI|nr:hypothetical protein SLEP1_g35806 [Rubroshorea leprosula]
MTETVVALSGKEGKRERRKREEESYAWKGKSKGA